MVETVNTSARSVVRPSVLVNLSQHLCLTYPHGGNTLVAKKEHKFFYIHKCVSPKCPYYLHNLKKWMQKF